MVKQMKGKIISLLGVCYVVFALGVATNSSLNKASIISVPESNTNPEGEKPRRKGNIKKRLENHKWYGWLPNQAREAKISETPVAQKDRTRDFRSNCLILWTVKWCSSCEKMDSEVKKLREKGYTVYTLDWDENATLAKKMGVRTLPTSVIWNNRMEVKRYISVVSAEKIMETLKKNDDSGYRMF